MAKTENTGFDPVAFLASAGLGRRIVKLRAKQAFFIQGGPADTIFYLQSGRAKLTLFLETAKKRRSACLQPASSLAKRQLRVPWGFEWLRRPQFLVVQRSKLIGK